MTRAWIKNGKIVVSALGQVILCPYCPCPDGSLGSASSSSGSASSSSSSGGGIDTACCDNIPSVLYVTFTGGVWAGGPFSMRYYAPGNPEGLGVGWWGFPDEPGNGGLYDFINISCEAGPPPFWYFTGGLEFAVSADTNSCDPINLSGPNNDGSFVITG